MPKDDPDVDDPMQLVGMEIPVEGPEALTMMVECFAEEFAALGHDEGEILDLFRDPFYGAAHGAFLALGEAEVRALIEAAIRPWKGFPRHRVVEDGPPSSWEV